jgi:phage tail sheath gpL-like
MKINQSVKRSGFLAAVITTGLILSGVSAFAADIILSGTVAPQNTVVVVGLGGVFDSLDLTTTAAAIKVADVTETSNNNIGYTVSLTSANAAGTAQARLKGAVGNTMGMNYSITYGPGAGTAVTLGAVPSVVTDSAVATVEEGVAKILRITYTGISFLNADTYTDTITLTIAAK